MQILCMSYYYRSVSDLYKCIIENIHKNPEDIDLVVGMPRSGLLSANMLALHLNVLLTDVERFIEGKLIETGFRLRNKAKSFDECLNVLILEDSVASGRSIREIKSRIGNRYPEKNITYAAVFVKPKSKHLVDIYYDVCPSPRLFEWNLMHHQVLKKSCVELDGILCTTVPPQVAYDSERYTRFLETVRPCFRPTVNIRCIVSDRPEIYRVQTEEWLKRHSIEHGNLVMLGIPIRQVDREKNHYSNRKAKTYTDSGSALYMGTYNTQSREIVKMTGKPVLCFETMQIINPVRLAGCRGSVIRKFKELTNNRTL